MQFLLIKGLEGNAPMSHTGDYFPNGPTTLTKQKWWA